jgi:DNA polymerase III gamma/tau subunit
MRNFPAQTAPKCWADYYGQEDAKRVASTFITNGIKANPRSILITGQSGTGKSTFIQLLIKSMRCFNRAPQEVEPCGNCPACNQDPRLLTSGLSDVLWVQPGSLTEGTLESQTKAALQRAAKGHVVTDRPERDILWVVFDEWQRFPRNIRHELLARAEWEIPNNNVCYVFLTMQLDKLPIEEQIAFQWRCACIHLRSFTEKEIKAFLVKRFRMSEESADLVASESQNSLGLAKSHVDSIAKFDPYIREDSVLFHLSFAKDQHRWKLWELVRQRAFYKEMEELMETLETYTHSLRLLRQLKKDIRYSIANTGPTPAQIEAMRCLHLYQHSYQSNYLPDYLLPIAGLDVVTHSGVFRHGNQNYGYV